jgi:tRNA1(Val) A37 N6-methylase TrmN6
VTQDSLLDGRVELVQPLRGYRVSVDTLLLAGFAAHGRRARFAVDLGAGVGAAALVLSRLGGAARLALVEREPELADLARQNLARAELSADVYTTDLERSGLPRDLAASADLVIANPPFFSPGEHRGAAHPLARSARHGAVEPFVVAAARALTGPRGRAAFVYPARSLEALLEVSRRSGLVLKRLRLVHANARAPARVALCELRLARPGGLVVEPPLFEWLEAGRRSPELAKLTEPRARRAGDRTGSRRRRAR